MATGSLFLAVFGTAWLCAGSLVAFGVSIPVLACIVAGGTGIVLMALRQLRIHRPALAAQAETPERKRIERSFNRVNTAQWVSLVVVCGALATTGHGPWIPPAIMLVVGLHFFPLAVLFNYRWHHVTGAALVLLAITYPLLAPRGPESPIGLAGAGLILWASAIGALTAVAAKERIALDAVTGA